MPTVEIINSDGHDPKLPFMIVDRFGLFVDLARIDGELFDPTVARITWGEVHPQDGRIFGVVQLKNGTGRPYWDRTLIAPYVKAWQLEKAKHDAAAALVEAAAQAAETPAIAPTAPQPPVHGTLIGG